MMEWKHRGQRSKWQDISAMSVVSKSYWGQWKSIVMIDDVLYHRWEGRYGKEVRHLFLTPKAIFADVLRNLHDSSTSGHFGVKKTLARVRQRFYWMKLRWTVENWCKRCEKYASRKGYPRRVKAPLKLYNAGSPMERVPIDLLGPLPTTDAGNQYMFLLRKSISQSGQRRLLSRTSELRRLQRLL